MTTVFAPTGATQRLHDELARTRTGRRWERIYHAHERELDALMVVHPDVREHVLQALLLLVGATECRSVDEATIRATSRVLDDLTRLGTTELRSTVAGLREELSMLKGGSLDDLLDG
jgi:hypothetical protein